MSARWNGEVLIVLVAFAFGCVRPFLGVTPVSGFGTYEAAAHLFVGGLFGAAMVTRDKWYVWPAVALSLLELICFVVKHGLG